MIRVDSQGGRDLKLRLCRDAEHYTVQVSYFSAI